jgi:hypothetical protein
MVMLNTAGCRADKVIKRRYGAKGFNDCKTEVVLTSACVACNLSNQFKSLGGMHCLTKIQYMHAIHISCMGFLFFNFLLLLHVKVRK